jgi:hypothetical protein
MTSKPLPAYAFDLSIGLHELNWLAADRIRGHGSGVRSDIRTIRFT